MNESMQGVIIGGILATVGSVLVSHLERRWARSERKNEKAELESAMAFAAIMKLVQVRAWYRTIRKAIDECFNDAEGTESEHFEPGLKVLPLVGMPHPVESLTPEELGLALRTNDQGLVEKVLMLQANYAVSFQVAQTFSLERSEYTSFVRDNAKDGKFYEGNVATIALDAGLKHALDAREITLNRMLNELLSNLDEMIIESENTTNRFSTALNSMGIKTPKITFVNEGQ